MAAALFRASRVAAARVSARRAPVAVAKAAAVAMPRMLTVSAPLRAEDDSHDDFKPVSKVDTSNVSETISKVRASRELSCWRGVVAADLARVCPSALSPSVATAPQTLAALPADRD